MVQSVSQSSFCTFHRQATGPQTKSFIKISGLSSCQHLTNQFKICHVDATTMEAGLVYIVFLQGIWELINLRPFSTNHEGFHILETSREHFGCVLAFLNAMSVDITMHKFSRFVV